MQEVNSATECANEWMWEYKNLEMNECANEWLRKWIKWKWIGVGTNACGLSECGSEWMW
jgi:hypothetical protein